ncbi:VP1054 [Alphabaculovirus myunipunctae]|uniref:VP1054 n=1 Tax=Mythimna unipuncta nucleopolyhedrovirus TaxID=447897 RepID=A0A2K9VSD0_9ABAC|nr:VP1054 [Mythimna unipuncta nucleopolyhedrovirus]AUV65379.1 VP1054 [Mythimna unipuncta nucleopolyhedrovirus]
MSSTTSLVRLNQCVSEKLVPFKPIKLPSTQCPIHPLRANCRVTRHYDDRLDASFDNHITVLNGIFQNYDRSPFYMCLVNERDAQARGAYANANEMFAYVHLQTVDDDEEFFGIDEAGERSVATVRNVIKTIMDAFAECTDRVVLMIDELQVDLLFSAYRCIVLPQRMVAIYTDASKPVNDDVNIFSVPDTDDMQQCQIVYKTFLIYNTVLTMLLKQRNPFNDYKKNISVIFRTLGKCPANKDRIKCCDLQYGGNAPGHIMCAPREMVKKIFHYAKWARTPNNYRRYFELIVAPQTAGRNYRDNSGDIRHATNNTSLIVLDWYNFINDFRTYFGVTLATA